MQRGCALAQPGARALRQDRPAAESEHVRLALREHVADDLFFDAPEAALAVGEELDDRRAGQPLDLLVDVEKRTPDPRSRLRTERRFARAHEPDERDVPVQRRVRHSPLPVSDTNKS